MIPNFFLVGAPKAGTTSIYHYLAQHPQVFVPEIKEPHFFSCPEVKDTYYDVEFVEDKERYESLYADCQPDQLAGDFSPSYLFSATAAQRIHETRPDAKIIMILRDPVDRAVSHFLMDVRHGYQTGTLGDCLSQTESNRLFHKEYVEVGKYAAQVERFTQLFAPSNTLILLYDDYRKSSEATIQRILEFLGLEQNAVEFDQARHNAHVDFRSQHLKKLFSLSVARSIGKLIPAPLRNKLLNLARTTKKPDLSDERAQLHQIYETEVAQLAKLIQKDLSAWQPK